jgi:hypothetical protein
LLLRIAYVFSLVIALVLDLAILLTWGVLPSTLIGSNPHAAEQSDSDRFQELLALIEKEIGTPTATEATQCKLIPFGAKPCGGPARYLVYSTARTDEARLKQLVNEFNQLSKKINQENKLLSDCMYVTEPKIEFARGVCTIAPQEFRRAE